MKKSFWAALLCIIFATTLLISGCSSSGTASRTTGDSTGKGQETSGRQMEDSESVPDEGILVGSDSLVSEGESEEEIEEDSDEKTGEETGETGDGEDGINSVKASGQEAEKEEKPAGVPAEAVSDDAAASGQKTETSETEVKEPAQKQEEDTLKEDGTEKSSQEEGQEEKKEEKKKEADEEKGDKGTDQGKKKEDKDILKDLQAGLEGEYIPDGFEPEGNYVLIYDSGYTVKTRYSKAGLTYYWGSEEFFFKLNKDLPDMKAYTAHMLFNTAEPMSDPGDEVFPYEESYVLYVDLDNGNSYQIAKYSLDRTGRIFVRELFESFRQRWEGTF